MSENLAIWNTLGKNERLAGRIAMDPKTGCWNWTKTRDKDGYGKIEVLGQSLRAHRYVWAIVNGRIPSGMLLCHSCDNPSCVNPGHMFLGDHKSNHADRGTKNRTAAGEGHGRAKITKEQATAIAESKPGPALAARLYGISKSQYYRIVNGTHWRTA